MPSGVYIETRLFGKTRSLKPLDYHQDQYHTDLSRYKSYTTETPLFPRRARGQEKSIVNRPDVVERIHPNVRYMVGFQIVQELSSGKPMVEKKLYYRETFPGQTEWSPVSTLGMNVGEQINQVPLSTKPVELAKRIFASGRRLRYIPSV